LQQTTLLSVVAGILEPPRAKWTSYSTTCARCRNRRRWFRRQNIGFGSAVQPAAALTAAENVSIPLILAGQSRRRRTTAVELLERMEMGNRANAADPIVWRAAATRMIARTAHPSPAALVDGDFGLDAKTGHDRGSFAQRPSKASGQSS
jgi:ABC-type lipoprotein export system ATPase subunit